jgi:hypothetical protein
MSIYGSCAIEAGFLSIAAAILHESFRLPVDLPESSGRAGFDFLTLLKRIFACRVN